MCDPVTAAVVGGGMLASGWATHNQTKAANRNAQAMQTAKENAYKASMDRQDAFADESRGAFNTNLQQQGREGFNEQLQSGSDKRLQAFNDAKGDSGTYDVTASAPKNVRLAQQQAFGDAEEKVSAQDQATARLSGYGDAQFNQGLARNAFGRAFGDIADEAGGDIRILPLDMQQARNRAYKAPNTALNLAKTGGKLAVMAGSSGAFGGGGAPTGGAQTQPWVNPDNINLAPADPNLPWKIGGYT